jgi:hypothetical protein
MKGGLQAYSEDAARLETLGVTANRLQNLTVTLDKVRSGCCRLLVASALDVFYCE